VFVSGYPAFLNEFVGRRLSRKIIRWKGRLHFAYRQQDQKHLFLAGYLRLKLVPDLALYFRTLPDSLKSVGRGRHLCLKALKSLHRAQS
jgi:hypothetical protein